MTDAIGFIGLGAMGAPMARNLLRAGFKVVVFNRTPEKSQLLADAGAELAPHFADMASRCRIVVSMLSNDAALESVTSGPQRLAQLLTPGGIHISMSTVAPATTRKLAIEHAAQGSTLVAAPVFGRPDAAAMQKLWICTSGAPPAKAHIQPVLAALGQGVRDFGEDPGAANIVKLCGNFMILAAAQAMAEAFALAEKSGLAREDLADFFGHSVFACPVYQNYGRTLAQRRYVPAGFKLDLGMKDLRLVRGLAESTQVPMALADLLHERLLTALAHGQGDLDWTAIELQVAKNAGLIPS